MDATRSTAGQRGHLSTEQRNPRSSGLDAMSIGEMFDVINAEDATIATAVAAARDAICRAATTVADAWSRDGRLIYVGAGTSGRLGVLDAAECPPTFLTDPAMVIGVIAGGDAALKRSIEGAEDSAEAGTAAVADLNVNGRDVIFGITTGGTTPYVHGAIDEARRRCARTVFFACVSFEQVPDQADISIRVLTGPEVITGSTRMKAGTATKMVLNAVTTMAMVRFGKVYDNLMVDVDSRLNAKLRDRGTRLVQELTGRPYVEARALLGQAGGHVKTAAVMHHLGLEYQSARQLLESNKGNLRAALNGAASCHPAPPC